MGQVRPWFLAHLADFTEKRTSTSVGRRHYVTIGQLVPIERVVAEVDGVRRFDRVEGGWAEFANATSLRLKSNRGPFKEVKALGGGSSQRLHQKEE